MFRSTDERVRSISRYLINPSNSKKGGLAIGAALDVVQQAYAAFGRHDIPALVKLIADKVDWECVVPATLPYAGRRRTPEEVAKFFEALPQADEILAFEPREFIEAGEHVTVLGWEKTTAVETQKLFETEWAHVLTVKSGKITRWRGFLTRPRVTKGEPRFTLDFYRTISASKIWSGQKKQHCFRAGNGGRRMTLTQRYHVLKSGTKASDLPLGALFCKIHRVEIIPMRSRSKRSRGAHESSRSVTKRGSVSSFVNGAKPCGKALPRPVRINPRVPLLAAPVLGAVRQVMKDTNLLPGREYSGTRLERLNLTDSQQRDAVTYEPGQIIEFHGIAKGIFLF